MKDENMNKITYLSGHTSEDTAYLVKDYPWGFTMRTEQRHWIETNPKLGDRHVTQTKNPKTGAWCKPKKSTYYAVMVLFLDPETGYLRSNAIHRSCGAEGLAKYKERMAGYPFSSLQLQQLKRIDALNKTMSHFTFECKATTHEPISITKLMQKDPEEMEKAKRVEEEQEKQKQHEKEMMGKMNQIYSYYMSQ